MTSRPKGGSPHDPQSPVFAGSSDTTYEDMTSAAGPYFEYFRINRDGFDTVLPGGVRWALSHT